MIGPWHDLCLWLGDGSVVCPVRTGWSCVRACVRVHEQQLEQACNLNRHASMFLPAMMPIKHVCVLMATSVTAAP